MSAGTNGKPNTLGYLICFATTILISSFLIFQVQPLISKYILPWFGGTPGVWSTCMLFFQVTLFAGYAYAHLLIDKLSPKVQFLLHIGLLILAFVLFPYVPSANWAPSGTENPTLRILGLLATSVGLPYFLLSATGPLLQAWFSRSTGHANPYWLYALSNVGSLAGLVSYPFVFEPRFPVDVQAQWWSYSFIAFALCCAGCAFITSRAASGAEVESAGNPSVRESEIEPPPMLDRFMWFALSASASILLLATTNQVCLDIAVLPFLWVIPLTLYLLSFILCFGHRWFYPRPLFMLLFIISLWGMVRMMFIDTSASMLAQVLVYFAGLFVCCMVCHGELVRMKPHAKYLTSFYLSSSAGGAFGGILVGLIAPYVFDRYLELPIGLGACCLSVLAAYFLDDVSPFGARVPAIAAWGARKVGLLSDDSSKGEKFMAGVEAGLRWMLVLLIACGICLTYFVIDYVFPKFTTTKREIVRTRNFYGVLKVEEIDEKPTSGHERSPFRDLVNGRILHGKQLMNPNQRRTPTTYYGETTGIGLLMRNGKKSKDRSVGLVGLGAGTMAAYGDKGDQLRFYEINPAVEKIAREQFTFIKDCPGEVKVILGDARLSLQRELKNNELHNFDVLVLDAFSSDAIPVHLLTREAFEIYLPLMAPKGVIAIHISNRHFDLAPVVLAAVDEFKLQALKVDSRSLNDKDGNEIQSAASWILVGRDATSWGSSKILERGKVPAEVDGERLWIPVSPFTKLDHDSEKEYARSVKMWTDNFSNVVEILLDSPLESETWNELWDKLWTEFWDKIRNKVKGKEGEPAAD